MVCGVHVTQKNTEYDYHIHDYNFCKEIRVHKETPWSLQEFKIREIRELEKNSTFGFS